MPKRMLLCCSLALLLGGCATKPQPRYLALEDHTRSSLQSISVRSVVSQDEVLVRADTTLASIAPLFLGVGVLTAVVDAGVSGVRQGNMQNAIEPFYDSVDDVDVRRQVAAALNAGLAQGLAIRVELPVEGSGLPLAGNALAAKTAALAPGKGFLQIRTDYAFTPDFRYLRMDTRVDLWQSRQDGPVYSNEFHYQSALVSSSDDAALAAWSAERGARYRQTLEEAIAQVVKMIRIDLAPSAEDTAAFGKKRPMHQFKRANAFDMVGAIMDVQPGRAILRAAKNGYLYSLPNDSQEVRP